MIISQNVFANERRDGIKNTYKIIDSENIRTR